MARAAATTVQQLARAGVAPAYAAAAADENQFSNDGRTFIHILNVGAEMTATFQTPGLMDGLAIGERIVTIPLTTGNKMVGPFPPDMYNQSTGVVYVDWSRESDVTFAVVRM